ncbi:MAG: hypothetical protein EBR82_29065 [Caulobacteraceae bacterium]|nr:hypothetical protein [Caulobacteraceae bacterium]
MKVAKQKIVRLTKKEAIAIMDGLELAVSHFGVPKRAKSFMSAVMKLDKAFAFGIVEDCACKKKR